MDPKTKTMKPAAKALMKKARPTKATKVAKIIKTTKTTNQRDNATRPRTDMVLAMNDPYMQEIIDGTKTYEFRKYNMEGVERIWFYRTSPHSAITHVCEVDEASKRNPGDAPLPEDGVGNKEYNDRHADWDGYDYAYRIRSVHEINNGGITWAMMRDVHGFKIAPRGRVMLPQSIATQYEWAAQTKIR